jgi:hypothetical protein
MGRKEKDFIMCKIYKDVACCGCGECLEEKREEYKYKKTDIWNVWMDERPKMMKGDGTIRKL